MGKGTSSAIPEIHRKQTLRSGLVREIKVWRLPLSVRYPDGLKYRLVLVNPETGEVLLLFDNHWPKGPHIHFAGSEVAYLFAGLVELLTDFRASSDELERKAYESKKNQNQNER